jgi:hypothetical protein
MSAQSLDRTEIALLEERLRRARARVATASPGGPEFDAAMAWLEELEDRHAALTEGPSESVLTVTLAAS